MDKLHSVLTWRLAQYVAVIARLKHPNPIVSGKLRPVLVRMSLLASQLAEDAVTAIEHQDPLSGSRRAKRTTRWPRCAVTVRHPVRRGLPHGVEQAVDAALVGR